MTLREEPESGAPANRETRTDPPEPAATPTPAAMSAPAEDHVSPGEPDPRTGGAPRRGAGPPAGSSGPGGTGRPARRRRSRAAFVIGGSVAACLAGLGGLATVLLLHARTHAGPAAPPPPVFRLNV